MTENSGKTKEDSETRGLQRGGVGAPVCRRGILKRGLKCTGERFRTLLKEIQLSNKIFLGKNNFTLSECLVLPITVLLAVVAYASLAAVFYNTDG